MSVADRLSKTREVASAETPRQQLNAALAKFRPQLEVALPAQMTVDRFISLVNGAVSKNPAIAECDPASILQSVGQAARTGLEIDMMGHAYLVPYFDSNKGKKICQFIPGWQGIVDLINRSEKATVWTGAVFDGDLFDYELGLNPFVRHRNEAAVETKDTLLYVYAIGQRITPKGYEPLPPIIEVWKKAKIEHHLQTYNKVGKNHYALKNDNNFIQYARKIPLLQVAKYMPKSAEISKAIEAANRADTGETMTLEGDFVFPEGDGGGSTGGNGSAGNPASTGAGGKPTPETYAQLAEKLKASKSRDDADLILDGARHLPKDQLGDLAKLADSKWPRS